MCDDEAEKRDEGDKGRIIVIVEAKGFDQKKREIMKVRERLSF